ncbi:MAG: twin-arginine translocase TatA/TatE family subunit [Candidatus Methanoperedenaceae archaeon]|nr:twin-arginine translocase TatA/TatE family subunit [Candidatus Methanoperedenaceae archaeon]MDW7726466.1 twin-arginine translocase TatA/TatE family subunit [Candidatus Methanoperedens sp.]
MIGTHEVVLILLAALFLFGPSKLPELAQSIGKAVGEFKKAQVQAERQLKTFEKTENKDIKIHNLAVQMGIDVEGKTTEQLIEEIRSEVLSGKELNIKTAETAGT